MLYKITFFKNQITGEEWFAFFKKLFTVIFSLPLVIIFHERKIDFFVKSGKDLTLLNHRLYPFYLDVDVSDNENYLLSLKSNNKRMVAKTIRSSLFDWVEKEQVKGSRPLRLSLTLNKYQWLRFIPKLKLLYQRDNNLVTTSVLLMTDIYQFLPFDLTRSINSEISKVKPNLKTDNIGLQLDREGIIQMSSGQENNKLSVKSYDFLRHSFILGQSGSGKSFLIKLLVEDIYRRFKDEYCVVLLDPHASVEKIISGIDEAISIDFYQNQSELFLNTGEPVLSSELTLDLFANILHMQNNPNMVRVLKYSLNLLYSLKLMSVANLKKILTDTVARKEVVKRSNDSALIKFFDTEFQQLRTGQYETAILPILNLLSELDFLERVQSKYNLTDLINNNFLVSLPIQQSRLGSNVTKMLGGAIIQQIFTLMQSRLTKKRVILIVDEFSVVQSPSLIHILSEARKFGLTIVLSQQYLQQVSASILQSVFANMVNYFSFKLSRDDAEVIARNLNFQIDQYFLKNKNDPREVQEMGVKLLTDLGTREVIVRLMVKDHFCSPFKAKTVKVNLQNQKR